MLEGEIPDRSRQTEIDEAKYQKITAESLVRGQVIGDRSFVYQHFFPITADLYQTPQEKYQKHVLSLISTFRKQSSNKKVIHHILQLTIVIGAASLTTIVSISDIPKPIPAILSGIVTIATVIANYYKFSEHSRDLYLAAEELSQEYNWFQTKRGPYKGKKKEEAFDIFMDRTEALVRKQTKQTFDREKKREDEKQD